MLEVGSNFRKFQEIAKKPTGIALLGLLIKCASACGLLQAGVDYMAPSDSKLREAGKIADCTVSKIAEAPGDGIDLEMNLINIIPTCLPIREKIEVKIPHTPPESDPGLPLTSNKEIKFIDKYSISCIELNNMYDPNDRIYQITFDGDDKKSSTLSIKIVASQGNVEYTLNGDLTLEDLESEGLPFKLTNDNWNPDKKRGTVNRTHWNDTISPDFQKLLQEIDTDNHTEVDWNKYLLEKVQEVKKFRRDAVAKLNPKRSKKSHTLPPTWNPMAMGNP